MLRKINPLVFDAFTLKFVKITYILSKYFICEIQILIGKNGNFIYKGASKFSFTSGQF